MVDFKGVSPDLEGRIRQIMDGDGKNKDKIDSRQEYDKLSELLSGKGKVSGDEKMFVENLQLDYQEEFMVRDDVKQRVREIIKNNESNKADDNLEKKDLKAYKKTKGLTKEEKNWIQAVIDGRVVKDTETTQKNEGAKSTETNKGTETPTKTKTKNKNNPKKLTPEKKEIMPNDEKFIPQPVVVPVAVPVSVAPRVVNDNDNNKVNSNNGNVQQGGVGNVNINGDVTVNYNGVPNNTDIAEIIQNPEAPNETDKVGDPKNLSPEEMKDAREKGEVVADKLFGNTSNTEQSEVQKIVNQEINSNNIIEFIRGYENKLAEETEFEIKDIPAGVLTGGGHIAAKYNKDHFFEQMRTEWDFPEKQELMHKVGNYLRQYLADKYGVDSNIAKEVAIILLEKTLGEKQAEQLDQIAQQELAK